MNAREQRAELKRRTSQLTPWTQRPGWVARVKQEIEHDRKEMLRRSNKLPQEPATPDQLQEWTRHTREVFAEHGVTQPPRSLQSTLGQYGAKACTSCLEVLSRETGFYSGDAVCKPCAAARSAEYRETNQEEINQRRREVYADNPEPHRERTRQWARENRDYAKEYQLQYRQQRPLVKKLNSGLSRAIKAGNQAEHITPEELEAYWESVGIDSTRCYFTGAPLDPSNISLDHGQAISKGGSHTLDNLFPCTIAANLDKNTRTVAEYLEHIKEFADA